jgi:hypothetical protein
MILPAVYKKKAMYHQYIKLQHEHTSNNVRSVIFTNNNKMLICNKELHVPNKTCPCKILYTRHTPKEHSLLLLASLQLI